MHVAGNLDPRLLDQHLSLESPNAEESARSACSPSSLPCYLQVRKCRSSHPLGEMVLLHFVNRLNQLCSVHCCERSPGHFVGIAHFLS